MKTEVMNRLEELRLVIPSGATNTDNAFTTVLASVNSYFGRGEGFREQVYETLKRVVFDGFMIGLQVEKPELLPELSKEYPDGYEDVRDLFDGNGAFEEILLINDETFRAEWYSEVISTTPPTYIWHNRKLEEWGTEISGATASELERLSEIEEFCRGRYESWTLPLIFEDVGRRHQRWSQHRRDFADYIYIERGWDWLIREFGLTTYEPSYIEELRDGDVG